MMSLALWGWNSVAYQLRARRIISSRRNSYSLRMSPTSCCFVVMRSLLEWVRSEWKCKKKAAPNLSTDCRFFSVIAENLEMWWWPDREGGPGKGAYALHHGRATAWFLAQMFVAISLRRHRRDLAKQCREVTLI